MRVLMVSRTYTHPHDMGNRQRVFKECLKMKSMGWEVDFLYIGNINQCDKVGMQVFFGKEHLFFLEPEEPEPKYQIKKTIRSTLDTYGYIKFFCKVVYCPKKLRDRTFFRYCRLKPDKRTDNAFS